MELKETVRELLRESTFPYLAAYEYEWIDSDRKNREFDEMGKAHLKMCLNMLIKQKYIIERGIVLQGLEYDKNQQTVILGIVKELYMNKVEELKKYLMK